MITFIISAILPPTFVDKGEFKVFIERVQVEEGFLNGLDLRFDSGLNVLIGPRGCGKTSIIEIIRFCLDVPNFTEKTMSTARQHALSILGSGQVTVTLRESNEQIYVTRTKDDETFRATSDFSKPIILSQNEIETVGLEARGKLKIIDGFKPVGPANDARERSLLSQIGSLTIEMQDLVKEIDSIRTQIESLSTVQLTLVETETQEKALLESLQTTVPEQNRLKVLVQLGAISSVKGSVFDRVRASLVGWRDKLLNLTAIRLEKWPESAGASDVLDKARTHAAKASDYIQAAIREIHEALEEISQHANANSDERFKCEEEARGLRQKLESLKQGAGAVSRRIAELKEKAGQLTAFTELLNGKLSLLELTQMRRGVLLRELERIREARYQSRLQTVESLNAELGPRIQVTLERFGLHEEYIGVIAGALRGSRLHYHSLARVLAEKMSPQELVEAIEAGNVELISELGDMAQDRARNLIAHLRAQGVEDLITCRVEDAVQLHLLDGKEYKSTEALSTGQRCTVILPLLLNRGDESLLVDQPEDHLDNAFIVDTLIQAIRKKPLEGQRIFSTHNANIPVLGETNRVILLGSDGKRGFVRHAGPLDDPASVRAITSVMEGGIEAFRQRAKFYQRQS